MGSVSGCVYLFLNIFIIIEEVLILVTKFLNFHMQKFVGEFVLVHAVYQSYLSADAFIAPSSKPNDGIIWLLVIKAGVTRVNLLQVYQ